MSFAIKAEVCDPRAKTFAFTAQKTMYGGKHIAEGDTDHFSSRAPDASRTSAASRGPFYFAWGCFRDFVSGLRGVPPIACRRRA
jgi:hypothetical protein